jgi:hypothetical protein
MGLDYSQEDFKSFVKGKFKDEHFRVKCFKLIEEMDFCKLEKVFTVLSVI